MLINSKSFYSIKKGSVDSLSDIESDRLLKDCHQIPELYTNPIYVHEIFEAQVEQRPDAIAVVYENTQLTYQELNKQANQLAHCLRSLGVGSEVLVGICLEHSLEMPVGLLGVLKAGSAYVPLDPAYPQERLNFILSDSQTPVIVTLKRFVKNLPEHTAQVICLDSDAQLITQQSQQNPINDTTPENQSKAVYIDSSTEQPKSVVISHSSICNQLYWRQTVFKLTQSDRVFQTNNLSFDLWVLQIFRFLCFGEQLIMSSSDAHQDTPNTELVLPNPKQQIPLEWTESVQTKFSQQVQRVPQQLAVVDAHSAWTYAELEKRTNQLANYLLGQKIQSQEIVAIYGHRSASLVWAILGILKAGAAFVILDPAYPANRLIDCLETVQPRAWLQIAPLIEPPDALQTYLKTLSSCVCPLQLEDLLADYPTNDPAVTIEPDNLAYVAFTSGSTGKPKGIKGTHRPLSHFLEWHSQTFGLNQSDRFSMLSGLSHDPLLRDIFTPLSLGATLFIPEQKEMETSQKLTDWMQQQQISVAHLTPAMGKLLTLETSNITKYLRYLFFGGDILTKADVDRMRNFAPLATCVNFYGATETPQAMGYFILKSLTESSNFFATIPLGRGIQDVQLLILTPKLELAGIGESGEIYIRTPYLAQGYIGSDELTQEKFIINPFTQIATDRLYKTGDLGRYLPTGDIEFIGRIDYQLKIRGFRIELAEIEATLNQHPAVENTVVMAHSDESGEAGNKYLVAYVVTKQKQDGIINELRHFLCEKLPNYMIPRVFVTLDVLPLTPNGKIDRRALSALDITGTNFQINFVAPRNHTEKLLADIWGEILRHQQVGINDNFLELGGHSLLATLVISRVRETFSVDLPLRCLFEFPTIAELCQLIDTKSKTEFQPQVPGIERVSAKINLPLSFAQQRLWMVTQLQPDSSAYNIPIAYRITGQLNVAALEQSLNEIGQRHEALRTTFTTVNGEPIQVIHQAETLVLSVVNLQDLPEIQREEQAHRLIAESAGQFFDITCGPLWRVQLLRLNSIEHILLLTIHHIVFDEWSLNVLFRELAALYQAFCVFKRSPLLELPVQYVDFAHWQRQWLQGEKLQSHLNYWKQQLANSRTLLELPTDRPRPQVMTYSGKREYFPLPQSLTQNLRAISQQEDATLFMILLAAFKTLLYRYSRQSDIIVGTAVAGRNRQELEGLIGFFVNTIVLRSNFSDNPTFRELLKQQREVALGAYEHQDLPFEKLVEELQPLRSSSYHPLFQVMFVFQNAPKVSLELGDLILSPQSVDNKTAQFDLTLELKETAAGLNGCFEYNTDLFDDATITRMVGHFQTLLTEIVVNPEQRVSELLLLSAAERHQVLVEWNNTQVDYPQDVCLHQLFELQVEKTPDAVAVIFAEQTLTYRELNNRANQLAHYLQKLGVKPDVLVGLCIDRSLEMVVGMLGILKAGGAYVPLDPAYPQERLEYMLSDSRVSILLTLKNLQGKLPESKVNLICLDADWKAISVESENNCHTHVTADNLAYVIYTSGSTGQPKGVMIPHRGICNQLYWRQTAFELTQSDRLLQTISFSFDPSVWQIFWPLCFGAQLIMARPGGHQDSAYLVKTIAQQQITVIALVPSMLRVLLEEKNIEDCKCLKHVTCGGEALPQELIERFFERLNLDNVLHNCYGPTEASIDATFWTCQRGNTQPIAPIGRPIDNAQIYILDSDLQPLPVGEPGELHIGGIGLARGYLNRLELTDEKFISNPFSSQPGARIYKTGDLACYSSNGDIQFLGRIDHQVKIRGFRIELGEIEATLLQHPGVQTTTVIAREDIPGDKRLVAYIIPNQQQVPTIAELSSFLKQKLAAYMLPSAFVMLESLPLTPNGKIDRQALKPPSEVIGDAVIVAPRNSAELQLTQIWQEVLGMQHIGVTNNFFDLGGHSLVALRMLAQIEEKFGKTLLLSTLLQTPTIEELAKILNQEELPTLWSTIVPIQAKGKKPPLFCIHAADGNVIVFQNLARHLNSDQPVYGLQPPGLDTNQMIYTKIEDMAFEYIKEIRSVQPNGPYFLSGFSNGGVVAFEMAQQLVKQGEEVALLALLDTYSPLYSKPFSLRKFLKVSLPNFLQLSHQEKVSELSIKVKQKIKGNLKNLKTNTKDLLGIPDNKSLPTFASIADDPGIVVETLIFQTQLQAVKDYVPQVYSGKITLFRCDEQPWWITNDTQLGWDGLADLGVQVHNIPGGHHDIVRGNVKYLAQKLQSSLLSSDLNNT